MFQRFYFFALSKSTGIESFFSFRTSQLLFLLRANRVEFERIYNLSTPLILLRAKRVGFESFLLLTPLYTCKYTDSNKDIIIIFSIMIMPKQPLKSHSFCSEQNEWGWEVVYPLKLHSICSEQKKEPRGSEWKKALNPSRFAQSKKIKPLKHYKLRGYFPTRFAPSKFIC